MSLARTTPGTMLGLAVRENRHALTMQRRAHKAPRARHLGRMLLTMIAAVIAVVGFVPGTAQAWGPFDDLANNAVATAMTICKPENVPLPQNQTGIDTLAGLNKHTYDNEDDNVRKTVMPNFNAANSDDSGKKGGNSLVRLDRVYGENADTIKPTYERYGFAALKWHSYGNDCASPATFLTPITNIALQVMVILPTFISMTVLNLAMNNLLYDGFSIMMQPFIGAMYDIFNPWIYFLIPIGAGIAWLTTGGNVMKTIKALAWGVFMGALFMFMGSSTSTVVSNATNIVTSVSGTAACKMNDAHSGNGGSDEDDCDPGDATKSINQSLWYGVPYETWHIGAVGNQQATIDDQIESGKYTVDQIPDPPGGGTYHVGDGADDTNEGDGIFRVPWSSALLNANYAGSTADGNPDKAGLKIATETRAWNSASYIPEDEDGTKPRVWASMNQWQKVPYLANVKMLCDDRDGSAKGENEGIKKEDAGTTNRARFMFAGLEGRANCDPAGANSEAIIPAFTGDDYNTQFSMVLSGMIGAIAVGLTVLGASIYLVFQKMMFFFLLFLAPVVIVISSLGDRKRRPFIVRYAEIVGVNLLKQVAAVCVVLFVSYAISSLFENNSFHFVPWILKPYLCVFFMAALIALAFPVKSAITGAVKGDTSVLDKAATAPQRALKTAGKVVGVGAAVGATAVTAGVAGPGIAAAVGGGSKAAAAGKIGSMLGSAGRVAGFSKTGRLLRGGGQLLKGAEGVMNSKDAKAGKTAALNHAANTLINDEKTGGKYRDEKGKLLPDAQKMAKQDAQGMMNQAEHTERATKARDASMASFFKTYKDQTGQHHQEDPNSAANQRTKRLREEQQKRMAEADADFMDGNPAPVPGGPQDPPGAPDGGTDPNRQDPGSQNPRHGERPHGGQQPPTGPEQTGPQTYAETAQHYREQAVSNLTGPAGTRDAEYAVRTVKDGNEVLEDAGIARQQAVENPMALLSGDAYNGGATTAMDPFHPATAAMNELRFASSTGDEDKIQHAVENAAEKIAQHGAPAQVDPAIHSVGDRAQAFESVALLGAMPTITANTTPEQRADASYTMMGAQVAMPEGYAAREQVQAYTDALANPSVDYAALETLQMTAINAINEASQAAMANAGAPGPDPAPGGGPAPAPEGGPSATGGSTPPAYDYTGPAEPTPPGDDPAPTSDPTPPAAPTGPSAETPGGRGRHAGDPQGPTEPVATPPSADSTPIIGAEPDEDPEPGNGPLFTPPKKRKNDKKSRIFGPDEDDEKRDQ